jgi:serine/threonine-protein kinase ATR
VRRAAAAPRRPAERAFSSEFLMPAGGQAAAAAAAAAEEEEQGSDPATKFSEFLQVFLAQEEPDAETVAQARELIPLLVRTLIVVDNPAPEVAIPILDWCDYLTESVPGCHGDGDPKVVGPIVIRLLQAFTRSGVPADILRKIADVAGKLLSLLAGRDTVAFGLLCTELVAATGDLITIASQWGAQLEQQQGDARVFLVFLDQFGRSICGETEIVCVSISSAEQAWSGAQVVLRCLWQYAQSSCQLPQHALQPCAPELWAHLERVADEAADDEIRDVVLRLVEFLLCHSVFPDFVDSVLDVLARMLSSPDADFWQFEQAVEDGESPEPTRREVLVRCLGHGIGRAVEQSPTPPQASKIAEIMPRLLVSRSHISVKVAACKFFANLLQQSSPGLEGAHTAQLVNLLGTADEQLQQEIIQCLRVAVAKRLPTNRPQKRGVDATGVVGSDSATPGTESQAISGSSSKRRRLSAAAANPAAESQSVDPTDRQPTELVRHNQDVLLKALQDCLVESLRAGDAPVPTSQLGQHLSAAAACLQIFIDRHSVLDWNQALTKLDAFLKAVLRPYVQARSAPDRAFVALWTVVVELLGKLLWQVPIESTGPFQLSFTKNLSLPLTDDQFRESKGADVRTLVCSSARALTLAFPDGKSRLMAETLFHLMQSKDSGQVVEAVKLCPFVVSTSPQSIKACFSHLAKAWSAALQRGISTESSAVLLATLKSLGPLCCICAANNEETTKPSRQACTYHERTTSLWKCCAACDGDRNARGGQRIDVLRYVITFAKDVTSRSDLPASVVLAFAQSMSRVLRHMNQDNLRQPKGVGLIGTWLGLMKHESEDVREAIVDSIGVVLTADDCLCAKQLPVKMQQQASDGSAGGARQAQASDVSPPPISLLMYVEELCCSGSHDVSQTMLRALGQLARFMSSSKILVAGVLKRLLIQLTVSNAPAMLRVTAYEEINAIASSMYAGIDTSRALANTVRDVQSELYPGLVTDLFRDRRDPELHAKVAKMIRGITAVLDVEESVFHRDLLRVSLPTLVRHRAVFLIDVVKYFATLPPGTIVQWQSHGNHNSPSIQEKLQTLVTASLNDVLVDGLLHCKTGKHSHSDFLEHLSKSVLGGTVEVVDLHNEIRSCMSEVVDTAVWEMGREDTVDPRGPCKGAVACLEFVAGCQSDGRANLETLLVENFPFLMERVNSVLDTEIKQTQDEHKHGMVWITNGSDSDGCHALRGLRNVIELMGNSMKKFIPVVISTLKKVLERKGLRATALTVWSMLVHQVPAKLFGPYLCQIVAHLMDVIEQFPDETVAILDHLLDSNKRELKKHFHELPFLPRTPALDRLNKIIDAEIGRKSSVDKLSQLLQGVYNDSPKVRALALMRLREELRSEWKDLVDLVGGPGQQIHAVIDLMVAALRRGCTDLDVNVRTLSMECFGELGAIDPTKLPPHGVGFDSPVTLNAVAVREHADKADRSASKPTTIASPKLLDIDLVAELLNVHLSNVIKAAQGAAIHDRGAFAIQETLRLVGIVTQDGAQGSGLSSGRRSSTKADGDAVWKKLTEPTKTLVTRFKETKYLLGQSNKFSYPGFYDCVRQGHQKWVRHWAYHLTSALQKCKNAPQTQYVYHVCRAVTRMDMSTANFLLPYLVWDMICYGDEADFEHISQQIVGVLKMKLSMHEQVPQCQQVLFSLLDRLRSWVDDADRLLSKQRSDNKGRVKLAGEHAGKVRGLLDFTIPKIDLAQAALQCKAFQRALFNFEEEIRARSEPGTALKLTTEELAFLQKVYVGLNDSDGLAGVASTRVGDGVAGGEPALRAQIVDHEAAGRWVDATTCYGVLLQSMGGGGSQDSDLNDGLMRCMRELGHFHAVLTHAQGTIKACTSAGSKSALHSGIIHAADAAWRLGEWNVIDDLKKHEVADPTHLSVGVGNILRRLEIFKNGGDDDESVPTIVAECDAIRQRIGRQLSAACMESYERAYPWICQLHQLQELEHACRSSLFGDDRLDDGTRVPTKSLVGAWHARLDLMQPQLQCREPVLALRRALLQISRDPAVSQEIGNTWIELAQTARGAVLQTHGAASDQLHTAAGALMQQTAKEAENFHIEKAKLSWAQNNRHQAVTELTAAIARMGGTLPGAKRSRSRSRAASQSEESPVILAKMQLLLGKYGQQTSEHSTSVVHHFQQATRVLSSWDKSYFYLARYYDAMYTEAVKQQQLQEQQPDSTETEAVRISAPAKKQRVLKADKIQSAYERLPDVIHNYGRALCLGHKYLFRCLPRMLTLWFEFSEHMHDEANKPKPASNGSGSGNTRSSRSAGSGPDPLVEVFRKVEALIEGFKDDIATYQWFTALPQLISRSTHPNKSTQQLVKDIIGHILAQHPNQAVWIVAPAAKSKNSMRAKIATEIIRYATQHTSVEGGKTIQAAGTVIHELINVCKHKTQDRHVREGLRVSQHFPQLKEVLSNHADGRVLVPVQSALTVVLPNDGGGGRSRGGGGTGSSADPAASAPGTAMTQEVRQHVRTHQAFSQSGVMIEYAEDKLQILNSLMKPSRLTLRGSDGRAYDFLCKREDKGDMRKDSRLMEFNTMLNRLLRANPESAKRALRLRTFCVCPLNEECGLIEWVPNTQTLRNLVQKLYEQIGIRIKTTEIRDSYDKYIHGQGSRRLGEATPGEIKWMTDWCRPKFEPVFHKWLAQNFPEPSRWFATRLNVARSTAVWSMVGYILGLGDRHGENILFDTRNGECVHVDFSCLFEKGLALQQPEVVPFRLTPNMVDILGVTGTEGAFREVSEVTMKLLREKQDLLMTNLETFLHDPLVEWNSKRGGSTAGNGGGGGAGAGGGAGGGAAAENNRNRRPLEATHLLGRVKAKLNGQGGTVRDAMLGVVTSSDLPLSVSGQVHRLILDATAVDKLAAMYVWWMAWY